MSEVQDYVKIGLETTYKAVIENHQTIIDDQTVYLKDNLEEKSKSIQKIVHQEADEIRIIMKETNYLMRTQAEHSSIHD
jgi:hypothetical protein